MMSGTVNVALAGEEAAGLRVLGHLATRDDVRVVLVLSSGHGAGRSVAAEAADRGLRVEPARRVADAAFAEDLVALEVDLLLNVHSLTIAHADIVDAPRIGSFNLHPGPLPAYAGLNAPSWAVYERATEYAVTLHWMVAAVDAGPIAYASSVPLGDRDTALTVLSRCVRAGVPLVESLLDAAANGASCVPRLSQPGAPVDRGQGPPNGGLVDWNAPAVQVEAFVRACDYGPFPSPWGRPRTTLAGRAVGLVRARLGSSEENNGAEPGTIVSVDGEEIVVTTGAGSLRVSRVEHGGSTVAAAAVLPPGARFFA